MAEIIVDVWLYGQLARHGGAAQGVSHANVECRLPEGATMADLLARLRLPTEERGITFISGNLSAMPGLQPDLVHVLKDGDRVGIFDPRSMWPFQYRHGAALIEEMAKAMDGDKTAGLKHSY
jgi:sulfur carrier protein ThiS